MTEAIGTQVERVVLFEDRAEVHRRAQLIDSANTVVPVDIAAHRTQCGVGRPLRHQLFIAHLGYRATHGVFDVELAVLAIKQLKGRVAVKRVAPVGDAVAAHIEFGVHVDITCHRHIDGHRSDQRFNL